MKQRGFIPNFHINLSVGDLHISRIGPPIFLQQTRQNQSGEYVNRSQIHECRNWERGWSVSGNICFKFSVQCLCSAANVPLFKSMWADYRFLSQSIRFSLEKETFFHQVVWNICFNFWDILSFVQGHLLVDADSKFMLIVELKKHFLTPSSDIIGSN